MKSTKVNNFKFLFLLLLLPIGCYTQTSKKADKDTEVWRYEIEAVSEGKEGTYLVKVWSYSKKAEVSIEQAKKNAVHGVIFQGIIGNSRVSNQPPIASDPAAQTQYADYFNVFFKDNGPYMKYVSVSNDGSIAPGDRLKVNKEYKIGVVVSIRKDLLKKDLEAASVIKRLDSGF
jgi:hypothetical protein